MKNNELYYDTLINSLAFSPNIKNDLNVYCAFFNNNRNVFLYFAQRLGIYLEKHKGKGIFDLKVKNNVYEIISYLYSRFPYSTNNINDRDKLLLNEFLNSIKVYLNCCSDNNLDFIREQILMRDYGSKSKLNPNWRVLKKVVDCDIELCKGEYYASISRDILIMNLLNESSDDFYNNDYEAFLLNKDFYRSINYFWLTSSEVHLNKQYYERISFIINTNLDLLMSGSDDFADEEFADIHNATHRLLKIK